jgi:hypothetical protein
MSNRLRTAVWLAGTAVWLGLAVLTSPAELLSPSRRREGRITLNVQNMPIGNLAPRFAAFAHRSIVVDKAAQDALVTAHIEDMEWNRALGVILEDNGLRRRGGATGTIHIERAPKDRSNPR